MATPRRSTRISAKATAIVAVAPLPVKVAPKRRSASVTASKKPQAAAKAKRKPAAKKTTKTKAPGKSVTAKGRQKERIEQDSPLLNLPPELRNEIYRFSLVESTSIKVQSTDRSMPPEPALLQACSQIRNEAISIFYQENKFRFWVFDHDCERFCAWLMASKHRRHVSSWFIRGNPSWDRLLKWLECYYVNQRAGLFPNKKPLKPTDASYELRMATIQCFAIDESSAATSQGLGWRGRRSQRCSRCNTKHWLLWTSDGSERGNAVCWWQGASKPESGLETATNIAPTHGLQLNKQLNHERCESSLQIGNSPTAAEGSFRAVERPIEAMTALSDWTLDIHNDVALSSACDNRPVNTHF